jgi:hypothetical protein
MPETYTPIVSISGTATQEPEQCPPPVHRHHHPGHVLVEKLFVELVRFGAHADAEVVMLINRIKSEFR